MVCLTNRCTAYDRFAIVEHDRLSLGDGTLRPVKLRMQKSVLHPCRGRLLLMLIADFSTYAHGRNVVLHRDEGDILRNERIRE